MTLSDLAVLQARKLQHGHLRLISRGIRRGPADLERDGRSSVTGDVGKEAKSAGAVLEC